MLFPIATRIQDTNIYPLRPGQEVHEEGLAMVFARDAGQSTVIVPSTGAAGEVLAGVSFLRNTVPSRLASVDNYLVPSNNIVQLPRAPIAGQLYASIAGAPLTLVSGTPAAPDEAQIGPGNTLLLFGQGGQKVFVQFRYEATVSEAAMFQGQPNIPGAVAANQLGELGIITKARVATSCFDASADWSSGIFVKLSANGIFTVGTANDNLHNVILLAGPSAGHGYIQLNINNSN
jgi:hypothetical protein